MITDDKKSILERVNFCVFFPFDLTLEFFLPVIRIFWSDGGSLLMTKVDIMQRVFPVRPKSMNTFVLSFSDWRVHPLQSLLHFVSQLF